jgi:excisionase family DNA binding protein
MTRHLSIDDAAAALGVSRRTVERHVKAGQLSVTYDTGQKLIAVPDEVVGATVSGESDVRHDVSPTRHP